MNAIATKQTTGPARWGDLLRHHRQQRGLTEAQTADRCGVSRHVYQLWEEGKSWPHGREVQKLFGSVGQMRAHGALLVREREAADRPAIAMVGPIVRPEPSEDVESPPDAEDESQDEGPPAETAPVVATGPAESSTLPPRPPVTTNLSRDEIGARVRAWRTAEKLSGPSVSGLIGVDNSYLMKGEKGRVGFSPRVLTMLVDLFPQLLTAWPDGHSNKATTAPAARGPRTVQKRRVASATVERGPDAVVSPLELLTITALLRAEPAPSEADRFYAASKGRGERAAERRWARRVARRARLLGHELKKESPPRHEAERAEDTSR